MTLTLIVLLAVGLDRCLGEPRNALHPLAAFGRWVGILERSWLDLAASPAKQRWAGILALLGAVAPALSCLLALPAIPALQAGLAVAILYFCIAARSLEQHATAVASALEAGDLALARQRVGYIVSRQTETMSEEDVRRAVIESVLENGADAVFAPLFWFVLAGPAGAVVYRLVNTLDAMWGYRNIRYRHFGWAAARFDDVLNWLPARLTALSYAAFADTGRALHAWLQFAPLLDSPNAGPVMSAGAGALNLRLGGPAVYHGQIKQKPWFGGDRSPELADISRACGLVQRTLWLWLAAIALGDYLA